MTRGILAIDRSEICRELGFTSRSLRAQTSRLLGAVYTPNQMGYDLGRLRLNRLIERVERIRTR